MTTSGGEIRLRFRVLLVPEHLAESLTIEGAMIDGAMIDGGIVEFPIRLVPGHAGPTMRDGIGFPSSRSAETPANDREPVQQYGVDPDFTPGHTNKTPRDVPHRARRATFGP